MMDKQQFIEEADYHIFVKWDKKSHIPNNTGDSCCGKKPKQVTIVPSPKDRNAVCSICWRNRDWIERV